MGSWKSEIKVLAGLASPEASLIDLQTAALFTSASLCARPWCLFLSLKDTSQIALGPIFTASFNLITSLEPFSPNTNTF